MCEHVSDQPTLKSLHHVISLNNLSRGKTNNASRPRPVLINNGLWITVPPSQSSEVILKVTTPLLNKCRVCCPFQRRNRFRVMGSFIHMTSCKCRHTKTAYSFWNVITVSLWSQSFCWFLCETATMTQMHFEPWLKMRDEKTCIVNISEAGQCVMLRTNCLVFGLGLCWVMLALLTHCLLQPFWRNDQHVLTSA